MKKDDATVIVDLHTTFSSVSHKPGRRTSSSDGPVFDDNSDSGQGTEHSSSGRSGSSGSSGSSEPDANWAPLTFIYPNHSSDNTVLSPKPTSPKKSKNGQEAKPSSANQARRLFVNNGNLGDNERLKAIRLDTSEC